MTSSNLNDLIDQAEERYPWIKRENLHDKQHIANDILHANRESQRLTENEDEAVRNWLNTVKT